MKRRLSLAIALLGKPKLLVLDETNRRGIDPVLRRKNLENFINNATMVWVFGLLPHVMDEAGTCNKGRSLLGGK